MAYLDLAEIPALTGKLKLFGLNRWGPANFLESDHLQPDSVSLDSDIRSWITARTSKAVNGPIRLLTMLRCWGYYFSPLNLYYVFNVDDTHLETIVAEVSNTPWGETHRYLLVPEQRSNKNEISCQHAKEFHVSPFMDMNVLYQWLCSVPCETLKVQIDSVQTQKQFFTAQLVLNRRELTDREIVRTLWRSPWMTARIVASIYWQAFVLWWKRCPFYPHPNKRGTRPGAPTN